VAPPLRALRVRDGHLTPGGGAPDRQDPVDPDEAVPAPAPAPAPDLVGAGARSPLQELPPDSVLRRLHPAVAGWFQRRFPSGPTQPQREAWPLIMAGFDVLVASPTGTGKTLTGFLMAIDAAYRAHALDPSPAGPGVNGPGVVYISPLRALAADVHENLQVPLAGIADEAARRGLAAPDLTVAVRTGDTPAADRAAMRRSPPDLLVTTPESLYLLLTAPSSRSILRGVHTVVVDEVHTLARDKRGAHLAVSLERLDHLVSEAGGRVQRIGLSATQRPLEVVARLLSGVAAGRPPTAIVDCGHRRDLDVSIELPETELEAVASASQLSDVLDGIATQVREHRTTLIFVNTRKMAERVAHLLARRLGAPDVADDAGVDGTGGGSGADAGAPTDPTDLPGAPVGADSVAVEDPFDAALQVAAHHGSLSAARRRLVEQRLRAGDLRALVATASLELGIDVGPVELVCQIGSPRAIGTFLQRVGRANHQLDGTPAGRLYPLTRDELVECTALLAGVRAGHLDLLDPPVAPLDILAQQVVAEVAAAEEWSVDGLFEMVTRAAPYAALSRETFDEVIDLVSWGIQTGRGRRGAHLHHDAVNGRLRARRGARLVALTSGGAIPETGDYRVVLDPDGVTVGSVHEDFAVEATGGDIFLLGTHSWRVVKVETGVVRVHDAGDLPPTIPFWLGEAPARTAELSEEVGNLRAALEPLLARADGTGARQLVRRTAGVSEEVADQVVAYLGAGLAALGRLPTRDLVVIERVFDETEGTQLVVHAPYGGRINRALGLALRKRFCVSFDFELQAAADDDTVVLSLGPQHSFPLAQVPKMLPSRTAIEVLTQALLPHPMLAARWRWNLNRALVVPRSRSGQRRPIHLQRMEAEDLLAAAWPALAACQENAAPGPVVVPDHVLVRQTVADCLTEPLDGDGLVGLLRALETGEVGVHLVESVEPSPLAHGILTGRPFTFLDGAPLEERRTRAVPVPRGLGPLGPNGIPTGLPVVASELAPLDPSAVTEVLDQLRPRPRDRDELHDLLLSLVMARPVTVWQEWFDQLEAEGRVGLVAGSWVATERVALAEVINRSMTDSLVDADDALAECVGGHLDLAGPVSVEDLTADRPLPSGTVRGAPLTVPRSRTALARLQALGSAIELPDGRWCARHALVRMHAASRTRRRHHVEPASIAEYVRFLASWQHVAAGTQAEGRAGLLSVIEQLQGVEVAAGEWERHVLPARVADYDPRWLDELCLSGEVAWARLTPRSDREATAGDGGDRGDGGDDSPPPTIGRRGTSTPSPATPLAITTRQDLSWMLTAVRSDRGADEPVVGASAELLAVLRSDGASFRSELATGTGRLPAEVDEGLWDLVARGLVTADAFSAVRSLLSGRRGRLGGRSTGRRAAGRRAALGRRRGAVGSGTGEGRWSLVSDGRAPVASASGGPPTEELAELVAWQLLVRWGVVAWDVWSRESYRVPWREVVRALRRFEARGQALGGRFVAGISGEQYALPEAASLLTDVRKDRALGADVVVAGADPLNLTGEILGGPRTPSIRHRSVHYVGGVPVDAAVVGVPVGGAPVTVGVGGPR
jgi:ATP-dependent helicase Lhr and Lhr-like helicase